MGRVRMSWLVVAILALTVVQLLVATFAGLDQFEGKGFAYRLVVYPVLMLVVPALWGWRARRDGEAMDTPPWGAFALIMAPFLVDATGNTVNLYDSFEPWDNINHFFNWFLLSWGLGLLLFTDLRSRWRIVLGVAALGALLAIAWEVGEWYIFIRRGVELDGAYEDTLSDEVLGTLGAALAGLVVARTTRVADL